MLLCVVGMAGSGKSSGVAYLEEQYGFRSVHFGSVVHAEVERQGLPPGPESEGYVRETLRAEYGATVVVQRIAFEFERGLGAGERILGDGLNSLAEYDLLASKFGWALVVVAVHADREMRQRRLKYRRVRPLSAEQVRARDHSEVALGKGGPIALADFHVLNNGSVETLTQALDGVMAGATQLIASRKRGLVLGATGHMLFEGDA